MANQEQYPNFVRGVAAAGAADLKTLAGGFADWQLVPGARIEGASDDPETLAAELLAKLAHPEHVFGALSAEAQDRAAVAVGVGARSEWVSPPVPPGTPEYRAPSWEKDVYAVLFARSATPAAVPRPDVPRTSHAAAWPELRSLTAWRRSDAAVEVAEALAASLGKGWKAADPAGELGLASIRSSRLGLELVAVPGGAFVMGLSPEERTALARLVKGRGPEATEHVKALTTTCRPVRRITVAPFLVAATPLLAAAAQPMEVTGDAANPHHVLRVGAADAAAVAERLGMRLLAEAEWEWLARAAGARVMVSGDVDPETWAEETLASPLSRQSDPLGILGLGWGEWVDDGWHPTYRKAPTRSIAWEPKVRPEVVRGGALDLWPWQVGGEVVLCHAAARDRAGDGAMHALRLSVDLPPRS